MQPDAPPLGMLGRQALGHAGHGHFHPVDVRRAHPAQRAPDGDFGHEVLGGRPTEQLEALLDQRARLALQQVTRRTQRFGLGLRLV